MGAGRRPWRSAAIPMALVLTAAGLGPASASRDRGPRPHVEVVAKGLNNPRQLTAAGGAVFVAEAGYGGDRNCQTHPEFGDVCFGLTGSVTRIDRKGQRRVLTRLPSAGAPNDSSGPADIEIIDRNTYVLALGLGGTPAYRAGYGRDAAMLGTVVSGRFDQRRPPRRIMDVVGHEARTNPDGDDIDSNATGLAKSRKGYVVVDAGGNYVADSRGRTLAVMPQVPTSMPGPLPVGTPVDSVPTDIARGPDGAWYVTELVGFPFEPGSASIYRLVPGKSPQKWAWGLTNVTSLAFAANGDLYAVQLADKGMLAGQPPMGSLLRVRRGGGNSTTVLDGLVAPYGVAVSGRDAYVTTGSASGKGAGQVLKISLRHGDRRR